MTQLKTDEIIQKLKQLLQKTDNVELISQISFYETITRLEKESGYEPITHRPLLPFLVGLSIPIKPQNKTPMETDVENILDLLIKYFEEFQKNLYDDDPISFTPNTKMISNFAIEQNLISQIDPLIRDYHVKDLLNNITSKSNSFFLEKFRIDVHSCIEFAEKITYQYEKKINQKMSKIGKFMNNAETEFSKMPQELKNKVLKNLTEEEYFEKYYLSLVFSNCKELFVFDIDNFCDQTKIKNKKMFLTYLNLFSCSFGTTTNFEHPLDPNLIQYKPIIELTSSTFFIPIPHYLLFNLFAIFENLMHDEKINQSSIWKNYNKNKSNYLEQKIYDCLTNIFPKSSIFQNLSYDYNEKPMEIDVMVHYDDKIFLFEAKSGLLADPAKRGGIKRLTSNLKDLVENAYNQAKTAQEYIVTTNPAIFKQKNNSQITLNFQKQKLKFFLINVTLEPLSIFNTQPQMLKELGFFKENVYPWSVDIYDLESITKFSLIPEIFMHYLERRLDAIKENFFFSSNELSFFSMYVEQGNFYQLIDKNGKKVKTILTNEWISRCDERGIYKEKFPGLNIEPELISMINVLKFFHEYGYTEIVSLLLDMDIHTRKEFVKKKREKIQQTEKDGKQHDFLIFVKERNLTILFVAVKSVDEYTDWLQNYCTIRKYETKSKRLLGILWSESSTSNDIGNSFYYEEYDWIQDNEMEEIIKNNPYGKTLFESDT